MQDATENECTRGQVTVSFQGINETNTEKKLQFCMSLANQFVIYEKKKYIYIYINL